MRRFLVGFLASVGVLALVFIGGGALFVWWLLSRDAPELPERMILTVDLRAGLPEMAPRDPLATLGFGGQPTVVETLLALERAADDPRVQGLVARLGGDGPGFAQAQELRDAIRRLGDAGKLTLAFADSFGEFGPGTRGYYLATAFEEIHLQPLGAVGLTGLLIETPLLRALLERFGVEPSVERRGRYKSVAEIFTETELSPANREMLEAIADSLAAQLEAGIAEARGLEPAAVARLIDTGPHLAGEALEAGLVDRLSYWDEVIDRVQGGAGGERVPLAIYARALEGPPEEAPVVALIHGVGQIARGESDYGPVGRWIMGGDTVADAIAAAVEDDEVRAILLRIDSGGGSAVASETIGREVRRAVEAGKPVIVSMAEVAASGGYWIAMDAATIASRPATLTGSIGVVAGKPVLAGLWDELGVNWGRVQRGANADMWSTAVDYDESGRERLDAFLDRTYEAFVAGVARGRGLPEAEVRRFAEGRVWTGAQALERGLVDDLGGFRAALAAAREAAGVAPDGVVELRPFPEPEPPWQRALELLRGGPIGLARLAAVLRALDPDVLTAPPLVIR